MPNPVPVPIQPGDYPAATPSMFERWGHPGRFFAVHPVSASTVDFTGSANFGAGGLLVTAGATGSVTMSNGGAMPLSAFATGVIHELSISAVTANGAVVYVLIRNNKIV